MFDTNNDEIAGYESPYSSAGPGGDETISITPASNPPLEPGPYFIAVHVRTQGVRVNRTLTAEVTVSESEIAARVPAFGIPASLITTIEGETPAPQSLEVRNSGRGTLDYQITADQSWLSVWPDQGSSAGETDSVEITVNPGHLEPGTFEGSITITEQQPAGFAGLFSDHTPAWPVTVPVTLIVIAADWEQQLEDSITGDGGPAVAAHLRSPQDVTVDAAGNLYIADAINRRIRRVDSSGTITTIAGTGVEGFSGDGGPALKAQLSYPYGVAVDAVGNLFFSEYFKNRIRRVDSSGIITTIAGTGEEGFSGDGGPAVQAQLAYPWGVAVDAAGNLFFTDTTNSNIYRVDPSGIITQIAGIWRGGFAGDGGPAIKAHLSAPSDVAVDATGNLFIADTGNHRIRRVDSSGIITTIAGTGVRGFAGDGGPAVQAQLDTPRGVAVNATGNLFIADSGNHRIRRVDPSGNITTIVGTGETGL